MGRRVFLLAILLGMSVIVGPFSARADCGGEFGARLACWTRTPAKVTLDRPLDITGPLPDTQALAKARQAFTGRFQVTVPGGLDAGAGGAILLVLADQNRRLVAPDSSIPQLDKATVTELQAARACEQLCTRLAQRAATGQDLLQAKLAIEPPASGGPPWTLISIAAALVLLAAGGAVLLLRSRRPALGPATAGPAPYPGNRPVGHQSRSVRVPSGPRRVATVRTDLHPQGYVEIDRCLYRAVWADSRTPPPTFGGTVDVVQGAGPESGMLIALPRSDHAP